MSAPPAPAVALPRRSAPLPTARLVVFTGLVLTAALAAALLAASQLPSAALAERLMGSVGEARSGLVSQELAANLSLRLRLTAGLLIMLVIGIGLARRPMEELVGAASRVRCRLPRIGSADLVVVGVVTTGAIGLRLAFLGQPMRYDEALSFNEFASRPLYYGLSFYPEPNNHLLNTLLVHVIHLGLGSDPWVLRLPALVAGALLVPATYWLARLGFDNNAGLLAAALVAASSYLVEYSTNSRGYTLQALCFVVALCLAVTAVRSDSLRPLLPAAVVLAIGTYAVPTMLYGIAVIGAWLCIELLKPHDRLKVGHLVAAALIIGLVCTMLYAPVVLVSGPERLVSNRFVTALGWGELAPELPRSLARTWSLWNRDLPLAASVVLVLGFAHATVTDLRRRQVPIGVLALAVCVALLVVQRVAPFERVWLFLLPLYLAIASCGLIAVVQPLLRPVAVRIGAPLVALGLGAATFASGSILRSQETGAFPDAEAVTQTLSGRVRAEDAVVTTLPASLPELQYYFPRFGLSTAPLVRSPESAASVYVVTDLVGDPGRAAQGPFEEIARFHGSILYGRASLSLHALE